MQALIAGIIAAFVQELSSGFWLRSHRQSGKSADGPACRAQPRIDRRACRQRSELARIQSESAARAGFESLAQERERALRDATQERETLKADIQSRASHENTLGAEIATLEEQLKSERAGSQEKLKLLSEARVEMSHQFEALAGKILDEKSTKFTEKNKTNLDQLLNPLRLQIPRLSRQS